MDPSLVIKVCVFNLPGQNYMISEKLAVVPAKEGQELKNVRPLTCYGWRLTMNPSNTLSIQLDKVITYLGGTQMKLKTFAKPMATTSCMTLYKQAITNCLTTRGGAKTTYIYFHIMAKCHSSITFQYEIFSAILILQCIITVTVIEGILTSPGDICHLPLL